MESVLQDRALIALLLHKNRPPKIAGKRTDLRVVGNVVYFDYPDFWVTVDELVQVPITKSFVESILHKPFFKKKRVENNTLVLEEFTGNVPAGDFTQRVQECWLCGNKPEFYSNPPPLPG